MKQETIERLRRRIERSSEVRPDCDCETCRDDAAILAVLEAAQRWAEAETAYVAPPPARNVEELECLACLEEKVNEASRALLALFEEGI